MHVQCTCILHTSTLQRYVFHVKLKILSLLLLQQRPRTAASALPPDGRRSLLITILFLEFRQVFKTSFI